MSPSQHTLSGTLFIVSIPIGNPEDITLRALRTFREADLLVAEDKRTAYSLLQAHRIQTEIVSVRPRYGVPALRRMLETLKSGGKVALIADAGTPCLADPGHLCVKAALEEGYMVTAVPGPSALLAALVLTGRAAAPFYFGGFPPRSRRARASFFETIALSAQTIVLYESPLRLSATLSDLHRQFGNEKEIFVAYNLTHTTERIFRGTLEEAAGEFGLTAPPGHYTLVI